MKKYLGLCKCCREEMFDIWDEGNAYCAPYLKGSNESEEHEGYCKSCMDLIAGSEAYRENEDFHFCAVNDEVELYSNFDGTCIASFVLDRE